MMSQPRTTPDRLLEVARTLFAERGYAGTTVRDIALAAEANLAAVGYHFGSKEGLYQEVLRSQVAPLANSIGQVCASGLPPLEKVTRIVHAVFEHIRSRPEMPPIIARELASGREVNAALVQTFRRLLPAVTGVIAEGQRDGSIRKGDPVLITLSVMAQPIYFNLGRKLLAAVAHVDLADPATARRMAVHAAAVIRGGIAGPRATVRAAPDRRRVRVPRAGATR
jgi:AcrR family transcriptional regulator